MVKPNLIQRLTNFGTNMKTAWGGLSTEQKGGIVAGSFVGGLVAYQFTPHAAMRRRQTQRAVREYNRTGKWPKYI